MDYTWAMHFPTEAVKDFATATSLLLPGVGSAIIRQREIGIPGTK
jgi:hypothetical protein